MSCIFLIPGLGADCRIFRNLDLNGHEVVDVNWITHSTADTLPTYTQRLITHYDVTADAVIIGNSLGGMLAIEIGKIVRPHQIILISSIRTVDQAPKYFDLFRALPVYKLIPAKIFNSVNFLMEMVFGEMEKEDRALFRDMLKNSSPQFLKWAISAILHWGNSVVPPNVIQISGDKDLIFPYKKLTSATIIKGGTHVMIFDKAGQINKLLHELLEK